MNKELLKRIIEAALMASSKPLSIDKILNLFTEEEKPAKDDIKLALATLEGEFEQRGVMLKEVSSGYRIQVQPEVAPWVARLWEEKPQKYSRALLETLALIAYRQPITRAEIEDIRGVSVSSNIMRTLQEREWVRVVGHRDVPGKPALYATTREFLDYFGLSKLDELPTLAEIRDIDKINEELDLGGLSDASNDEHAGEAGEESLAQGNLLDSSEPSETEQASAEGEIIIEQYSEGSDEPVELKLDDDGRPMEFDELDELQAVFDRVEAVEEAIDEDIHSALDSLRGKQDGEAGDSPEPTSTESAQDIDSTTDTALEQQVTDSDGAESPHDKQTENN